MAGFDDFYDREGLAFGDRPSPGLAELVALGLEGDTALDAGAGDGRNALFLAGYGFAVTAVDASSIGLAKLRALARERGVSARIATVHADVTEWTFPEEAFDLVVGVTLLDHLQDHQVEPVWLGLAGAVAPGGLLYVKVHTTDDPGFGRSRDRASELSHHIRHYFERGELRVLVEPRFDVLWYAELAERDTSHGRPHTHAFAEVVGRRRP